MLFVLFNDKACSLTAGFTVYDNFVNTLGKTGYAYVRSLVRCENQTTGDVVNRYLAVFSTCYAERYSCRVRIYVNLNGLLVGCYVFNTCSDFGACALFRFHYVGVEFEVAYL